MFLVFQVQDVQLLLGLFQLALQPGDLLLVGLLAFLELDLEQGELLHCLLDSLLILVEHAVGGSIL